MITLRTILLTSFLVASVIFSNSVMANEVAVGINYSVKNQLESTELEPRVSPLSKQYRRSIRMEKREQRSMLRKAKRKMMKRLLGKKWKLMWIKQF